MNRCSVNACPLVASIAEPREQPNYYNQQRSLGSLKSERPWYWYKAIHSQVLQDMVKRELRPGGLKARRQLNAKLAKLHQRIARQQRQGHFETAGELVDKAEVIFVEDLQVADMTRR